MSIFAQNINSFSLFLFFCLKAHRRNETKTEVFTLKVHGNLRTLPSSISNVTERKVSVKENEVPTERNSSRASISATKASYISN